MDLTATLMVGLILLVGELGVRVGMVVSGLKDHERRILAIEQNANKIIEAIRDLRGLIVDGGAA